MSLDLRAIAIMAAAALLYGLIGTFAYVIQAEVVAALEALGYSSREGREAARAAVATLPPDASLEDRVKEALQSLRQ